MKNVIDLDNNEYAIIDLDTGTVLGTNVVLVPIANLNDEQMEEIMSSDAAAHDYGQTHGISLNAAV